MPRLDFLKLRGSPFDVGQALGRFGAAAVHDRLLTTPAWRAVMAWQDSDKVSRMSHLVRDRFPGIWAELQGLAKGLELPFEAVFVWNCRGDVRAMSPDGCTTVQMPGAEARRIAHNEDGLPAFAGHCTVAELEIEGSPRFAAFVYPGSLPGHTFGASDAGLAMTVNNLRCLQVDAGVPRMVLTRALLDQPTLEAAVELLRREPRAGGFHLTLAHRNSTDLLSIEFNSAICSVRTLTRPALHANHALHPELAHLPQIVTHSSAHRQVCGDRLLAKAARVGEGLRPLAILADTSDAAFPIYRDDVDDSDDENTMATAEFTVCASHIDWTVHEHPRNPARFRMIDGHAKAPQDPGP